MSIRVLAVRTDFKHHGEQSGYKQILKYIHPTLTLGINERDDAPVPARKLKYPWLFEFEAKKYRDQVDILHLMYAEDYYRFSWRFFKHLPIVATYHQPADALEREIKYGDLRGRVGKITHRLNQQRFQHLAAAIVTNTSQKDVLQQAMPADKIHVLPLGIHLDELKTTFVRHQAREHARPQERMIVTVGNWLRDWDFYFQVVKRCPQWNFKLVSRNLAPAFRNQAQQYEHLEYHHGITDEALNQLLLAADVQFLPLTGIAGSNALIHALALGCPQVLTNIKAGQWANQEPIIRLYDKGHLEACIEALACYVTASDGDLKRTKQRAHLYATQFAWEAVAQKTLELYKQLL